MIICNIQGGLGNQMFQYAMGRSISLECNTEVKFSIDSFSQYQSHNGFELQRVFGIDLPLASPADLKQVLSFGRSSPSIRRALARPRLRFLRGPYYKLDSECGYDPNLLTSLGFDAYLHGYWQSEKYFLSHSKKLREDFSFINRLDDENASLLAKIQDCNAVSIHVRRGDYIHNPKAFATHGVCTLDYYRSAIELLESQITEPKFFIFTDDACWVRRELVPLYSDMSVINLNFGRDSYKDMQLMSSCSHHIIANSSFSWWGAWLNLSPTKTVIAPKKWFAKDKLSKDLLPENWIKI